MRSKHLALVLAGCGLSIVGLGTGCAGGSSTPGAGGTTGSSTSANGPTATSASSGTGGTTVASSTSDAVVGTGSGGSPNSINSFATAAPIEIDTAATPGTLVDTSTPDYYSFTGKAGQRLLIGASSHTSTNADDYTITDTVVTLYLPDMATVYAQDDDEWPRFTSDSQLFVELPQDGTYYYTVADCNAGGGTSCAPAKDVATFDYTTEVVDLTAAKSEVVGVLEGGTAPATTYTSATGAPPGTWVFDALDGDFASATDTQVIAFTPPTTTAVTAGARTRAFMWVQPTSSTGDGSNSNVLLTVKDMNGNIVAQTDQSNYQNGTMSSGGRVQLSFPLFDATAKTTPAAAPSTLGQAYTLEIKNEATAVAAHSNDYFIQHFIGSLDYGQSEAEFPGAHSNDTAATAETLTIPMGSASFFADGNVVKTDTNTPDVDWYTLKVPSTAKSFAFACSAGRDGSGLLGFTAELFSDQGTTSLVKLTETNPALVDLASTGTSIPIPSGVTSFYLQVSAARQDPDNTGTYYHCSVFMSM